jgi:hypothetical protein
LIDRTVATQTFDEGRGLSLAKVFEAFPYALLRAHKAGVDRSEFLEEE